MRSIAKLVIIAVALATATLAVVRLPARTVPVAQAAGTIHVSRSLIGRGDPLTVTGSGFRPGTTVVVFADFVVNGSPQRVQTAIGTNGAGEFSATITVPAATNVGPYRVNARDFAGTVASQSITVLKVFALKAGGQAATQSVVAGHRFFVRGSGFQPGEDITVSATFPLYNGNAVTVSRPAKVAKDGAFGEVLMNVPFGAKQQSVPLTATGATSQRKATAQVATIYRPQLVFDSSSARPGGSVTVRGSGYVPSSTVTLRLKLQGNGQSTVVTKDVSTDQYGQFTTSLAVPQNAKPGNYSVEGIDHVAGFTAFGHLAVVVSPQLSISPSTIAPGAQTTVHGAGFSANTAITLRAEFPLYGGGSRVITVTAHTDGNGTFTVKLSAPGNAASTNVTVSASGPHGQTNARLTVAPVAPGISLSPTSVIPGGTVTVVGSGYLPNAHVDIAVNVRLTNGSTTTLRATATASGHGSFSVQLKVPANAAGGVFTLVARSATSGRAPTAHLTVAKLAPSVVAVPTTAVPGTAVTINGFGYASGASIKVMLDGSQVASGNANGSGQFNLRFTVPTDTASGPHTITAVGNSGRKASFNLAVNRTVSTHYYFASLYTGTGYHEYLALLNPSAIRARVTITYELTNGSTRNRSLQVNAHSRYTVDVNADLGARVSASARVDADVPLAAERMVFHGSDGASVPGATAPATTWYFANGNTISGYREYIAVQNPGSSPVQVAVHFLPAHSRAFTVYRTMPATSRTTFKVNSYVRHDAVGAIVTANGPIVANRTIFAHNGMTSQIGVTSAQRTWYFAGGPTNPTVTYWIGAVNPTSRWSYVTVYAYGPSGVRVATTGRWLKPHARVGFQINHLAHRTNTAVVLAASRPIVAEQMTYRGRMHNAATDTFGVVAPARSWAFAAVDTTSGPDALALFNPSVMTIPVVVQYVGENGQLVQRTYLVGPFGHATIDVGSVMPNTRLGIIVTSNDPFVALNRVGFNNGLGGMTSHGISL